MPYLSALEKCVHDEALYKSTFTFTFTKGIVLFGVQTLLSSTDRLIPFPSAATVTQNGDSFTYHFAFVASSELMLDQCQRCHDVIGQLQKLSELGM